MMHSAGLMRLACEGDLKKMSAQAQQLRSCAAPPTPGCGFTATTLPTLPLPRVSMLRSVCLAEGRPFAFNTRSLDGVPGPYSRMDCSMRQAKTSLLPTRGIFRILWSVNAAKGYRSEH